MTVRAVGLDVFVLLHGINSYDQVNIGFCHGENLVLISSVSSHAEWPS